ncbi:MAG: hypothetical protein QOK29_4089 [Rhodospirillaceae bacterium]|jgi:cytochrome b561|nr:hypothetical protein [Rhodospirillaceae bacterium]
MMERRVVYSIPARVIHWLAATIIVATFIIGVAMLRALPGAGQNQLFDLHRSLGLTILALTTVRLLWRLRHRPPELPEDTPAWIRTSAAWSHRMLYVLMLALPILGWLGSSAFGAPVHFFGLFDLPPLVDKNKLLADVVFAAHKTGAFVLAGLVTLHVGAAFFHLLIRRDGVFRRMVG